MDRDLQLTPHFKLGELMCPGIDMVPNDIFNNLKILALALERVREKLGKPILITSGYRTPAHNQKVGGSRRSFHLQGMAADIVVVGLSAQTVQAKLKDWPGGLGYGSNFTHLDIRPYKARFNY